MNGPGDMPGKDGELPVHEFSAVDELRTWLMKNHATSEGRWVQIYKKDSGAASVTFDDVLKEGLCFGWSESQRRQGDERSYLEHFTPRRTVGTTLQWNRQRVARLIQEGRMQPSGLKALGMSDGSEK